VSPPVARQQGQRLQRLIVRCAVAAAILLAVGLVAVLGSGLDRGCAGDQHDGSADFVRASVVLDSPSGHTLVVLEGVPTTGVEHGYRLSTVDVATGKLVGREFVGDGRWEIWGASGTVVWLADESCQVQGRDAATARKVIDLDGLAQRNPQLQGKLLKGERGDYLGCGAWLGFDQVRSWLAVRSADGFAYAIEPGTWKAVEVADETSVRWGEHHPVGLRFSNRWADVDGVSYGLIGGTRQRLGMIRPGDTPDSAVPFDGGDVFLAGCFLEQPTGEKFVFGPSGDFLIAHHETAQGGAPLLSRVGRNGKAAWTYRGDSVDFADSGGGYGVFPAGDRLVLVGERPRGSGVEAVALDVATGKPVWTFRF
jgi:hypothetical protein